MHIIQVNVKAGIVCAGVRVDVMDADNNMSPSTGSPHPAIFYQSFIASPLYHPSHLCTCSTDAHAPDKLRPNWPGAQAYMYLLIA